MATNSKCWSYWQNLMILKDGWTSATGNTRLMKTEMNENRTKKRNCIKNVIVSTGFCCRRTLMQQSDKHKLFLTFTKRAAGLNSNWGSWNPDEISISNADMLSLCWAVHVRKQDRAPLRPTAPRVGAWEFRPGCTSAQMSRNPAGPRAPERLHTHPRHTRSCQRCPGGWRCLRRALRGGRGISSPRSCSRCAYRPAPAGLWWWRTGFPRSVSRGCCCTWSFWCNLQEDGEKLSTDTDEKTFTLMPDYDPSTEGWPSPW